MLDSVLSFAGAEPRAPEAAALDDALETTTRDSQTTLGVVELLLKQPARLDELNRQPDWQREMFPRLLLIGEAGFLAYALVMVLLLNLAPAVAATRGPFLTLPPASWLDGTCLGLVLAYTVGVLLAACVCLPSFYFYSLLAGVKISWLQISSLVVKGTAANAILLLGILPIYVAVVLGLVVFEAPPAHLQWALAAGLGLPFLTGLWGLWSIYLGILDVSSTLPDQWQCRRRCFLRRLVFSWAAVYAAVVPVMIFRLWESFAGVFQT
jgi:hypothetical protein